MDLEKPWPFRTGTVREILIVHTLEHLQDYRFFFREAWRVLEEWGNLEVIIPHGNHDSAFCDVDHQKVYYPASFLFLEPGYAKSIANPDYLQWKWFFGVKYVECKWTAGWRKLWRWPFYKPLLFLHNRLGLFGMCEEMWIHLTALKSLYTADWWVQTRCRAANCCPITFVNEFDNEKGKESKSYFLLSIWISARTSHRYTLNMWIVWASV